MALQLNESEVTTPPRPAASVMLLRDSDHGPEVFMLRRHGNSDVLGGAYVFPGGKVDADDHEEALIARLDTDTDTLHRSLADVDIEPHHAAGYFVAACRETFEECGVLFARGISGDLAERVGRQAREGFNFLELLESFDLQLEISQLIPWSRWITPRMATLMNKRFDTRFFVAMSPAAQVARHDQRETTEGIWQRPREALDRYWAREIDLAAPQIMTLAHFSRFSTAADILAEARRRPPPTIEPSPRNVEAGRLVAYPGDPNHPIRERAMPGPTRLLFRDGRFEPEEGFDALFS
jgi:8-oxo-dGTP pyrophosphatase MutT (NUDIX family)